MGDDFTVDAEALLHSVRSNMNQKELQDKIAQWLVSPPEDGEFTDEEILCILSDPNNYRVPKLSSPPHLPTDGYFYLYQRPLHTSKQDVPQSDGIQWAKRNKLDVVGREREDYLLHKSRVLCSFKAQSEYMIGEKHYVRFRYRYGIKPAVLPSSSAMYDHFFIHYRRRLKKAPGKKKAAGGISTQRSTGGAHTHTLPAARGVVVPAESQMANSEDTGRAGVGQQCAVSVVGAGDPFLFLDSEETSSTSVPMNTDDFIDLLLDPTFCEEPSASFPGDGSQATDSFDSLPALDSETAYNFGLDPLLPAPPQAQAQLPHVYPVGELSSGTGASDRYVVPPAALPRSTSSQLFTSIIDFAPAYGGCGGGGKVLICLKEPLSSLSLFQSGTVPLSALRVLFSSSAEPVFADMAVAEALSPFTLRCFAPAHVPESCALSLVVLRSRNPQFPDDVDVINVSPLSTALFTFLPHIAPSQHRQVSSGSAQHQSTGRGPAQSTPHSSQPVPVSQVQPHPPLTRLDNNDQARLDSSGGAAVFSAAVPQTNSIAGSAPTLRALSSDDHTQQRRMQKIRLVEKLGSMSHVLRAEDAGDAAGADGLTRERSNAHLSRDGGVAAGDGLSSGLAARHVPDEQGDAPLAPPPHRDWLDDSTLSRLSLLELEKLSDQYIYQVVNQLVNLADGSNELLAELDEVDQSGYALLHYCALYNLNTLVPILLAKGANIHVKASTPQHHEASALHLASMAGNLPLVVMLIGYGADIYGMDGDGCTPADRARFGRYSELLVYYDQLHADLRAQEQEDEPMTGVAVAPQLYRVDELSTVHQGGNCPVDHVSIMDGSVSPPDFSLATGWTDAGTGSLVGSTEAMSPSANTTTTTLLQNAFSSLSLTDKCALSLSLTAAGTDGSCQVSLETPRASKSSSVANSRRGSFSALGGGDDEESLGGGVISNSDFESLGVAMSLMAPNELQQVEDEVRVIQNNVRSWLLRKNYINLRDAAMTLQNAWRERKVKVPIKSMRRPAQRRGTGTVLEGVREAEFGEGGTAASEEFSSRPNLKRKQDLARSDSSDSLTDTTDLSGNSATTASTTRLQALTRGMLARKSFNTIKKQAIASLVIRKSVAQWWDNQHRTSASASALGSKAGESPRTRPPNNTYGKKTRPNETDC